LVSFILVNYNTKDLTLQTINSIIDKFKNSENYEIILVDNGSKDGSKEIFEKLEQQLKNFKYIYNDKNLGFGKANNIGFRHSKGDYIYILNSDTILHTKNINKIIEKKFKNYPEIGIIATRVIYEDGNLQPNVQNFSNLLSIALRLLKIGQFVRNNKFVLNIVKKLPFKPRLIKNYLENFNKQRKEGFVDWASGCSLIFKREVFEQLDGFDEKFFMYSEDEEICLRVHKSGYKILYTPDITIIHFEGKSNTNKRINEFLIKTKIKSEFYYYKKHFPDKYSKLKVVYELITFFGFPFSKRLRLIRKYYKELNL